MNRVIAILSAALIVVAVLLPTRVTLAGGPIDPGPATMAVEHPEELIRKVLADQTFAWNEGNLEGYMDGYWRSEQTVFISGGTVARGWQTVLNRYKKTYPSRGVMGELAFTDLEVNMLGQEAAVVLGKWSLTRRKNSANGTFTLVFRKLGKDWRIVHDHTSTDG